MLLLAAGMLLLLRLWYVMLVDGKVVSDIGHHAHSTHNRERSRSAAAVAILVSWILERRVREPTTTQQQHHTAPLQRAHKQTHTRN